MSAERDALAYALYAELGLHVGLGREWYAATADRVIAALAASSVRLVVDPPKVSHTEPEHRCRTYSASVALGEYVRCMHDEGHAGPHQYYVP